MFGYSVQLDESDIIYDLTHKEVLDQRFSPEKVIDQLLEARKVPAEGCGDKFKDRRFSGYVVLMLGMTTIPGQKIQIKKRGNKKRVVTCSDNLYINLRKFWQLKSISGNTMWPVRNNYLKRK